MPYSFISTSHFILFHYCHTMTPAFKEL